MGSTCSRARILSIPVCLSVPSLCPLSSHPSNLHQTTRHQFGHPCSSHRISGRASVSSPFVTAESMLDRFFSRRGFRWEDEKKRTLDPGPWLQRLVILIGEWAAAAVERGPAHHQLSFG
ncbi:hypothetical protein M440DRAFT_129740 [Trichoderma longibrachiatum ATCC 18648]|uniref:Uncharacterized protein n=1 Tax=Trichoderma longibrachiatum ATCC 18648 TaxID=983965 RepID=A0A2T4BVN2_TRILO|nr:hypothetical protein M440DRAFT_129740 [Trichoderma longibrachiatum ATCC 18648]